MAGDLTTLANLKAWLAINNNNADPLLTRLITAVTNYFLNECNRAAFLAADYTERFSGNDGPRYAPKCAFASSPINSVASVTVDGSSIPACPDSVRDGYVVDEYTVWLRGAYSFCKGVQNCTITLNTGLAAIPPELEQACIDVCALWYRKRDNIGKDSVSVQGEVVQITRADIPPAARNVLEQYTRRF